MKMELIGVFLPHSFKRFMFSDLFQRIDLLKSGEPEIIKNSTVSASSVAKSPRNESKRSINKNKHKTFFQKNILIVSILVRIHTIMLYNLEHFHFLLNIEK